MKIDFFGKFFKLAFLLIFLAEIASFWAHQFVWLNYLLLAGLTVLTIVLACYKLEYSVYLLLVELFIGSKGQLFFIDFGGQKISKTVGNVIDPVELVGKYGTDPVRYYLLQEISPFEDGDFSYEKFEECYNSKLANGLGNFTARVLALGEKLGEIKVDLKKDVAKETAAEIEKAKKTVEEKLDGFRFHEAIAAVWGLIGYGDAYINNEKPWDEAVPGARRQAAIVNVIVILDNVAALLAPFLPETAEKITKCVSWPSENTLQVKKSANLFPRI